MDNKKTIISGAKWMSISTFVTSLVAILRLSILAHFLEKSDFGIVAILTFIHGLTIMFSDMGFGTVVLHKQNLQKKEFSSLFWIQMLVYAVLYLFIICFTKPIAAFYSEPLLNVLLPLSMVDLFFTALGKLYEAVLQKHFQFKIIAIRNIVANILSLILALAMAMMGYGVYSLVISTLFYSFVLSVWNFAVGQKHVRLQFYCSIKGMAYLIKIGLYQTGTSIVDYSCSKLDVLIIGKFLGMEDLGVYNLSKEFIFRFIQGVNSIATKVLSPVFAKMQDNIVMMRNSYINALSKLTSLTFVVLAFIMALSSQIITILYGNSYQESGLLTSLLACSAIGVVVGNSLASIIIASGRTDLTFKYVWIRVIYTVPCIYYCSQYSIYAVAIGQILIMILDYVFQGLIEVKPILNLSLRKLTATFYRQALLLLIVGSFGFYIFSKNPLHYSMPILEIIVYGPIVFISFIILYAIILSDEFKYIKKLIKQK